MLTQLKNKSSRAVTVGVAAVACCAAVAGGVAYAVTDTVFAPYAQAAVTVAANGTILKAKGIDSVTRPSAGNYCVKVSDPDLTASNSIHSTASHTYRVDVVSYVSPQSTCGSDPKSIRVIMVDQNGTIVNAAFSLAVH